MQQSPVPRTDTARRSLAPWILTAALLVILLGALLRRTRDDETVRPDATSAPLVKSTPSSNASHVRSSARLAGRRTNSEPAAPTAEQIVAGKVVQFARDHREIARALALHHKITMPDEVERFFDAAEAGNWDELQSRFKSLRERQNSKTHSNDIQKVWPALMETFGVAEIAHDWPAQKLLDYGQAVLGSLRPGMVYVGGTDPGRFIPTLLNDTSEGERHVVLTQNALADRSYLDYTGFRYGDRLATLSDEDSQRAFSDYLADAQKRLTHDQQFPNEAKQLRPGEDVRVIDNRVQVSGQVAVMAINEKLLQTLLRKNPEASFALEESLPLRSTFGDATALGPIMELRVRDEPNALTAERAAQSVDYWRNQAQRISGDPEAADSRNVRMAYAKMAAAQAGLLQERGFTAPAEEAFRLATQIAPESSDAVFRYVNVLVAQGRARDAIPTVEAAMRTGGEDQGKFAALLSELNRQAKQ